MRAWRIVPTTKLIIEISHLKRKCQSRTTRTRCRCTAIRGSHCGTARRWCTSPRNHHVQNIFALLLTFPVATGGYWRKWSCSCQRPPLRRLASAPTDGVRWRGCRPSSATPRSMPLNQSDSAHRAPSPFPPMDTVSHRQVTVKGLPEQWK